MARLSVIELDQLPPMEVLEELDSEDVIVARMTKLIELWNDYDPPVAAAYDVENLEFDPVKITQELSTYFELLLRDRVNQAARSVTLAFAAGDDLDAIASRYPGGVPRLTGESDDRYRIRIWLSANMMSPHGVYEAYVFWALTAVSTLRDATASGKPGTPNVTVTIMAESGEVTVGSDKNSIDAFPSPTPSATDIYTVTQYIAAYSRKALTDVVMVRAPKIVHTDYRIRVWLFPSWDKDSQMEALWQATADLLEKQRWLGYSHTRAAIAAALKTSGVYNVVVDEPTEDVEVEKHEVVVVDSVTLEFAGRGGFEEPTEP